MSLHRIISSEIAWRLGWTLVHSLWQGTIAVIVLAVILRIMRRRSPQVRYAAALGALALLLLTAGITWRLVAVPEQVSISTADPVAQIAPSPIVAPAISSLSVMNSTPVNALPSGKRATFDFPSLMRDIEQRAQPILPWAACCWAVGVLLLSLRHTGGWIAAQRLRVMGIRPVEDAVAHLAGRIARRLILGKAVRVVQTLRVQTPIVVGWLRPMILLPTAVLSGLTPSQLEAILAHELAHIRRHDYLVNLLQVVAETLMFYHPAVWWISRKIRLEREQCCDDIAVAVCGDRYRYVESLAALEEVRLGAPLVLAARGSGASELLARIQRLLLPMEDSGRSHARGTFIAVMLVVLAITVGACIQHTAAPQKSSDDAWPLYSKAIDRVAEGHRAQIMSPAMSNLMYAPYPPYPPEWYAMEKVAYAYDAPARELARHARSYDGAHWPPPPTTENDARQGYLQNCRYLGFELTDAALYQHFQGDDAAAIESIRDALHLANLLDAGPPRDAVSSLFASGIRFVAMNRLEVIVLDVSLTDDPADMKHMQSRVARDLISEIFDVRDQAKRYGDILLPDLKHEPEWKGDLLNSVQTAQAEGNLAAMSLACHLFQHEKSRWPASMDELIPYLPGNPIDAYGQMGYLLVKAGRPDGADRPLVYSRWRSWDGLFYRTDEPRYGVSTGENFGGQHDKHGGQFRDVTFWTPVKSKGPPTTQPVQ